MKKYIVAVVWIFIYSSTHACTVSENEILEKYQKNISEKHQGQSLDFARLELACKSWPAKNGVSILVSPYVSTIARHDDQQFLGLAIMLVDDATGERVSELDDFPISTVDAISPRSVDIDTAVYKVTSKDLAFGLRIRQKNSSSVNPFSEEMLNLYFPDGTDIRNILTGLVTSGSSGEGGEQCAFERDSNAAVISILKTESNKFHDLKVRQEVTSWVSRASRNGCIESLSKKTTQSYVIKFKNKRYEIPSQIKSLSLNK
ncbi:hypothetical protein SBC1_46860 (plasmid) [Caballeronia sp. SBC1]|uniref:hypothetical protein n=1 Tax=unclassified Caballeronia TaxID=2646786 RepID=UPI0013E13DE9|nr:MULTISPECIES: hypothetical protein [unclassified Caballeronia]QIE26041.1 hypothetical protein SBC2_41110 [Caballeronia sp. SBC2]QIN64646.1 hypothetical protein SBC1_46860 [Caballeronia sp. SBC1]